MTNRDRLAGWQHLAEFTVACVGLFGWFYWVTHKEENNLCPEDADGWRSAAITAERPIKKP